MSHRLLTLLTLSLVSAACRGGKSSDDDDDVDESGISLPGSAEDVANLCDEAEAEGSIQTVTVSVVFEEPSPGCDFGQDGNMDRENGVATARLEQTVALELDDDAVICGMEYDFAGINGGEGTPMVYDDLFVFTFDDVVLSSSYAPLVDLFELEDGTYPIYDWDALVGYGFEFDNSIPTWCLGEDEGMASCSIPPPETDGIMSLDFDEEVVNNLSYRAVSEERFEFEFITIGDNDDSDCYHAEFAFDVDVPYVAVSSGGGGGGGGGGGFGG